MAVVNPLTAPFALVLLLLCSRCITQQASRSSSSDSSSEKHDPNETLPLHVREAAVLRTLCSLFALSTVEANLGDFREADTLSSAHAAAVRATVGTLCAALRPEAVLLVDAFHFSDALLCSAIGRYDGNVYPALMEWALQEQLNSSTVAQSFEHVKLLVGTRPGARL
jgi:Acyl-CoA oxidase